MPEDEAESCKGASPEPAKSPSLRNVSSYTLWPFFPLEEVGKLSTLMLGILLTMRDLLFLQCGG